jgi:Cu/Ag efflux protein CusF
MKINFPKLALLIGAALAFVSPLASYAQQAPSTKTAVAVAPGKAVATEITKASAVVVGIDSVNRLVTLKTANGKVFEIEAGPEVKNFAQIKVGDKVHAEYVRALSLELKKKGSSVSESGEQHVTAQTPAGAKPGATSRRQVTVLADVVAVNAKKQTVTLRGPNGNRVDLSVQDPAQLKNIKKGDQVEAVYTEAVAVAVESEK